MPKTFKFLSWSGKKAIAFLVLTIVLSVATVATTLAYLIAKTNPIENTFTPPIIDVKIVGDNVEGNYIQNTGDVPIYARVAIVATWVNDDGQTYSTSPDIEVILKPDWMQGDDGFYYLTSTLATGASSTPIESIVAPANTPDGYTLRVQVLASVIQATPVEAVENSWPAVRVDDTTKNLVSATN